MKNYIKEIMLIIIATIIVSSISVYATIQYRAGSITFEPGNENWEVENVEQALNELYLNRETSNVNGDFLKVNPISYSFGGSHDWKRNSYTYTLSFQQDVYSILIISLNINAKNYGSVGIYYYDEELQSYEQLLYRASDLGYGQKINISLSDETLTLPTTASKIQIIFEETYGNGSFSISKCELLGKNINLTTTSFS